MLSLQVMRFFWWLCFEHGRLCSACYVFLCLISGVWVCCGYVWCEFLANAASSVWSLQFGLWLLSRLSFIVSLMSRWDYYVW